MPNWRPGALRSLRRLTALAEEGLLSFNRDAARWTWDVRRIRAEGYTDNVVDLLLEKLRRLPATTQAVLKELVSNCINERNKYSFLAGGPPFWSTRKGLRSGSSSR